MSPQNTIRLGVLRSAPLDSWIALCDDETRIVAVGKSYSEVSDASERAGYNDPIILKTPAEWAPFSV
jgi:hypothetical protein